MVTATVGVVPTSRRRSRLTAARQTTWLVTVDVAVILGVLWLWSSATVWPAVGGLALVVLVRWRLGLYRARFCLSALDELPKALEAGLIVGGMAVVLALMGVPQISPTASAWLVITALALGLLRCATYVILRYLRRNDVARERLLLVGGGMVADAIAEMAEVNPEYGLDLAKRVPDLVDIDLPRTAAEAGAGTVLVAFSRASEAREVFEIRRGLAAGLTVMAVPRYFDLIGGDRADDEVFGVPVLRLGAERPRVFLVVKRGMDILLAALALVALSPVLLVTGLLVKRETGDNWFFRQTRIGKGGRTFELLRLQTVKPAPEGLSDARRVTLDSERVGPVGAFLRRTSIDGLPQLWNILRGDMSFVGPRPERPYYVEQSLRDADRLRIPAGLTGLAQIHELRGDMSFDDRARFDNRYEDHWSLWSDAKILLKSVPTVFKGAGG